MPQQKLTIVPVTLHKQKENTFEACDGIAFIYFFIKQGYRLQKQDR